MFRKGKYFLFGLIALFIYAGCSLEGNVKTPTDDVTKTITDINVKALPSNLYYTHGDALDLSGLVLTLSYEDGTSGDVNPSNFSSKGITTIPANGSSLIHVAHDGQAITVSAKGCNADAGILIVDKKSVTITGLAAANKTYDGTTTASISNEAVINGLVGGDDVTISAGTAEFTSKDAGTGIPVVINDLSLSGIDADNYILQAEQYMQITADITPAPFNCSVNGIFTPLPGETGATVIFSGFIGSETPSVGCSVTIPGFSISGTTLSYNGAAAFPNPYEPQSMTVDAGTNYTDAVTISGFTVFDGQADFTEAIGTYDRRIPLTKANIIAFNTYMTDHDSYSNSSLSKHYKLTEDIEAEDLIDLYLNEWVPIGSNGYPFTGTFDGQDHSITGLNINSSFSDSGMFGTISGTNAVIKNIDLLDIYIRAYTLVGGVAGCNIGGLVHNCSVSGNIEGQGNASGIVGYNSGGLVQNCSVFGTIEGREDSGGIVGVNDRGNILNCHFTGSLLCNGNSIGGIVGRNYDRIVRNCSATGVIFGYDNVGGIAGYNTGNIEECYSTGEVMGGSYVGGVAGYNDISGSYVAGIVINCYSTGIIGNETGSSYTGGITGYNKGKVQNCHSSGNVGMRNDNGDAVGGVVGYNEGTWGSSEIGIITDCYANGNVMGRNYIGGVIGHNYGGTLENSYADGDIEGYEKIGGVIGWNEGIIQNCFANGNVSGDYSTVGGVAGMNSAMLRRCYATGIVSGDWNIGGVVGNNNSMEPLQSCYATGNVSGEEYVGGVAGSHNYGTMQNCYATGNVSCNYRFTGGIAGGSFALMQNCYSTGMVTGSAFVGGVAGETNNVIRNCVTLNLSIKATNSWEGNIGRITGLERYGSSLNRNYARGMTVTGNQYIADIGHNKKDGANITAVQWHTATWWTTPGNWDTASYGAAIWDTSVWDIKDGSLPTLKNMPAGAQNPVLQ